MEESRWAGSGSAGHEVESEAEVWKMAKSRRYFVVCILASTLTSFTFYLGHLRDITSSMFLWNNPLYSTFSHIDPTIQRRISWFVNSGRISQRGRGGGRREGRRERRVIDLVFVINAQPIAKVTIMSAKKRCTSVVVVVVVVAVA